MRRLGSFTVSLLGLGLLVACQERLSSPAECPQLCPGTSLVVFDTVITATAGLDSSFTGYVGADQAPALLVSDGISAGEARAFATFPRRSDSVSIAGILTPVSVDSVALTTQLLARDSTVTGLKIFYYRVTPDLDSTVTLAALDAMMTPDNLIDSLLVSDTLRRGPLRLIVKRDDLGRLAGSDADSGRFGLGIRIKAPQPTGVRLGSILSVQGGPVLIGYGSVVTLDTAQQHQTLTTTADKSNYVIEPPAISPDGLVVGGKLGTRIILRFDIPRRIRDSATVLRATLELTPVGPIPGLRNDPIALQVRGVLVDLGAKSPALSTLVSSGTLLADSTDVQLVEVFSIVSAWFTPGSKAPTTLLMAVVPEGGSFGRPEFVSTADPVNGPRLRITYALPSRPGHP